MENMLVIGHSWANGSFATGDAYKEMEKRLRAAGADISIAPPITKVGSSIGWAQKQLDSADLSKFSTVVIFTGINDLSNSPERAMKELRKLAEDASAQGARRVLLFNIPQYNHASDWVGKMNERIYKEFGNPGSKAEIIDVYANRAVERQTGGGKELHPRDYSCIREAFSAAYLRKQVPENMVAKTGKSTNRL